MGTYEFPFIKETLKPVKSFMRRFQFLFTDDRELISWTTHSKRNVKDDGTKRILCACSHFYRSCLVVIWTINTHTGKVVHSVYVAILSITYIHFLFVIIQTVFSNVLFLLPFSESQFVLILWFYSAQENAIGIGCKTWDASISECQGK